MICERPDWILPYSLIVNYLLSKNRGGVRNLPLLLDDSEERSFGNLCRTDVSPNPIIIPSTSVFQISKTPRVTLRRQRLIPEADSAMGRYDFRPLRVHQTASQLLATDRILTTPSWYNVVGSIPPAQTLVRTQPLRHQQRIRGSKTKKASKLFQPQSIVYEEDALRKEFYKDHPWELARPRVVLENDGRDAERDDWSHMSQSHRPVSGER